ncbi:MAG: acetate--CoA ligase family protein [Flavobacteriales bacterium]|nr:acetate--CoA ligase family protein [Flavobacteriales bacterium]MCB9363441.1 acetate--CoA ligase family protein [Flavobacteriales bacterium]
MINDSLINPKSIVVVGASNNKNKPGGKLLSNIIEGNFKGNLSVVNPKESEVQNITSYKTVNEIPTTDLAVLAIPAKFCLETIKTLAYKKNTKAFIIISAGFSEETEEGHKLEQQIVEVINEVGACLIGPNCIGVLNVNYHGVFTTPIPKLSSKGCDLISSSGATAVFIMEAGMPVGLTFNSVFSVGNAAQIGVEEVLEYMDNSFDPQTSSKIKLLYIEEIKDPIKFYIHASSLIEKGCKIAAIKSGTSVAGGRAASSHTGALATSDEVVRALFRKSGIVYCNGRAELITIGSIFTYKELTGKNFAIITHAGGSAVMLTDALSKGGLEVPEIQNKSANELLDYLYPGSSVKNPIDFLATGTADQLGIIIDYCEHKFDEIDGIIVVFGSPGLFNVQNVYKVLNVKMDVCKKPIFPVLPSIINAQNEIDYFLSKGRLNFPDEVELGKALCAIYNTPKPMKMEDVKLPQIDKKTIRNVIDHCNDGFLSPQDVTKLLEAANIPITKEFVAKTEKEAQKFATELGFPIVMKVVGPVHKTDVNGVVLNVNDLETVQQEFKRLTNIKDATGVLLQQMVSGIELFIGAKKEENYGHLVMCGLGGIFIEILQDVSSAFSPITKQEATYMIDSLKGHKIFDGVRGGDPLNKTLFIDIIQRISALLKLAPEIEELDLNPLLAKDDAIIAVDARISVNFSHANYV